MYNNSPQNKKRTYHNGKSVFYFKYPLGDLGGFYSSNKISMIVQAAFATGLPGPKMAATPALYR